MKNSNIFLMNKRFIFLLLAVVCLSATAEVNYQVIPLPQQISIDKSGKYMLLTKDMTVGYPTDNAQMKRNAEFAAEYLGLSVTSDKKNADVNLMLGLKSMNPDAYAISVNKKGITIQGASESGVFYGIQTLRKSIMNETGEIRLPYAWVCGSPRFSYRGTELDCARHFFPVSFIKKFIDILALHGINRFHWHLTDDQGWRFEVKALPELAKKASVRSCTIVGKNVGLSDPDNAIYDDTPETGYYTQEEMREIVAYAAERFITIIPELDMPGHATAALASYPYLGCKGEGYHVLTKWVIDKDVFCPGKETTFAFLEGVIAEVAELFPRPWIHVGGDECKKDRWKSCPHCQQRIADEQLPGEEALQSYFMRRVEEIVRRSGKKMLGWDELVQGGLSPTVALTCRFGEASVRKVMDHGNRVLLCPGSHCYFDYKQADSDDYVGVNWKRHQLPLEKVYSYFPRLRERYKQLAGTLSGGEQQMLATGRALMTDPSRTGTTSDGGWMSSGSAMTPPESAMPDMYLPDSYGKSKT